MHRPFSQYVHTVCNDTSIISNMKIVIHCVGISVKMRLIHRKPKTIPYSPVGNFS